MGKHIALSHSAVLMTNFAAKVKCSFMSTGQKKQFYLLNSALSQQTVLPYAPAMDCGPCIGLEDLTEYLTAGVQGRKGCGDQPCTMKDLVSKTALPSPLGLNKHLAAPLQGRIFSRKSTLVLLLQLLLGIEWVYPALS